MEEPVTAARFLRTAPDTQEVTVEQPGNTKESFKRNLKRPKALVLFYLLLDFYLSILFFHQKKPFSIKTSIEEVLFYVI